MSDIAIYIDADGDFNQKAAKLMRKLRPSELRKVIKRAGKIYLSTAKGKAPKASTNVDRYSGGAVVATYFRGNLRRSIRAIGSLKRLKSGVLFRPDASRTKTGDFKGRKVDGWYAPFVEFGTKYQAAQPFLAPAWEASRARVLAQIINETRRLI